MAAKAKKDTAPASVTVTIGSDTYELVPSVEAAMHVCAQLGGLRPAIDRLPQIDIFAATVVIVGGAQLSNAEAKDLPARIFASGDLVEICAACADFCLMLMQGGKAAA